MPGTIYLLVTDAGFRGPRFRAVEAMGWHWLGRLRNRTERILKAAVGPVSLGLGLAIENGVRDNLLGGLTLSEPLSPDHMRL